MSIKKNILIRLSTIVLFFVLFFPSNVQAQTAFRYVSWGDAQDPSWDFPQVSNQAKNTNPIFTIFNGDIEDDGFNSTEMTLMINAMNGGSTTNNGMSAKTFFARGNHDDIRAGSAAGWSSYISTYSNNQAKVQSLGARNYVELNANLTYSFDYGNSRFIILDIPDGPEYISSAQLAWVDQRLTDAENNNPGLVHAFIHFHHPTYCVEEVHCDCTAVNDSSCINSSTSSFVSILNKHPIVSAIFNGDEHLLSWTHINSTRITIPGGITHEFEQFVTSPAGTSNYNNYLYPNRVDYVELTNNKGFATVDINGQYFTVSFYRYGNTNPLWVKTFNKGTATPTSTILSPTPTSSVTTPIPTKTPTPILTTPTPTKIPTITPTPIPGSSTTLISKGSAWKYLDNGSNQGTAWRNYSFNDSTWAQGNAKLGYGYAVNTLLNYGSDPENKYITTYFRKSFTITNPSQISSLTLGLLRDDGAIVYLNGTEVYRTNMPTGVVSYLTEATTTVNDGGTFYSASINPSLLVAGTNIIAIEVHQAAGDSSDLSLNFFLNSTQLTTLPTPTSINPTPTPIYSTPTPINPTSTTTKPGDANKDGFVNNADYLIWLVNYNSFTLMGASAGDFNGDNSVNGIDYVIWLKNYAI